MSGAEKPMAEKSLQDFLLRWSRRKLGIADPGDPVQAPAPLSSLQGGEAEAAPTAEAPPEPAAAFDPESLPPLESIDATTDIRAFLAPGVPAELTRAALRRAWTSDPAIRDFVGIAENQWDFTNPDSVPGFGSLEWGEEIRGMVEQLFGQTPQAATAASDSPLPDRDQQVRACSHEVESMRVPQTQRGPSPLVGEGRGGGSGGDAQASTIASHLSTPTPGPSPQGGRERAEFAAGRNNSAADERDLAPRRHGGALPK